MYTGKAQALGLKPSNAPSSNVATTSRWTELPIVKSPKIVQYSVGHEGMHCLMVADDGSVFFAGVAKRGEDGDAGSLCKFSKCGFNIMYCSSFVEITPPYFLFISFDY